MLIPLPRTDQIDAAQADSRRTKRMQALEDETLLHQGDDGVSELRSDGPGRLRSLRRRGSSPPQDEAQAPEGDPWQHERQHRREDGSSQV